MPSQKAATEDIKWFTCNSSLFSDLVILFKVVILKSRDVHFPYHRREQLKVKPPSSLESHYECHIEMANNQCAEKIDHDSERYRPQI